MPPLKIPPMPPFIPLDWFRLKPKKARVPSAREVADDHCAEAHALLDQGKPEEATAAYRRAIEADPTWSEPWFNLGLHAKYAGQWKESLAYNQKAVELDPKNEGAWWNLGIAATALGQWREARRAWRNSQMEMADSDEPTTACHGCDGPLPVRLDPGVRGEVVWGIRLDPARVRITNLPLPESGFRFGDVVLIDGAPQGSRLYQGVEIPVFNVLTLLEACNFNVFRVRIPEVSLPIVQSLAIAADEQGGGAEHWDSSVVGLCLDCDCSAVSTHRKPPTPDATNMFVAARDEAHLKRIEEAWSKAMPDCRFLEVEKLDLDTDSDARPS